MALWGCLAAASCCPDAHSLRRARSPPGASWRVVTSSSIYMSPIKDFPPLPGGGLSGGVKLKRGTPRSSGLSAGRRGRALRKTPEEGRALGTGRTFMGILLDCLGPTLRFTANTRGPEGRAPRRRALHRGPPRQRGQLAGWGGGRADPGAPKLAVA